MPLALADGFGKKKRKALANRYFRLKPPNIHPFSFG
jgi:hypothetical protein